MFHLGLFDQMAEVVLEDIHHEVGVAHVQVHPPVQLERLEREGGGDGIARHGDARKGAVPDGASPILSGLARAGTNNSDAIKTDHINISMAVPSVYSR